MLRVFFIVSVWTVQSQKVGFQVTGGIVYGDALA